MAKRKRKLKPTQFNKQNQAHKRNLYFKELKNAFTLIGCAEAFPLIPKSEYDKIYHLRFSTPSIVKSVDADICDDELKDAKRVLLLYLNNFTHTVPSTGNKLSLSYILTYIASIYFYFTNLKDEHYKSAKIISEMLEQTNDLDTFINEAICRTCQIFLFLGISVSELENNQIWFSSDFQMKKGLAYSFCFNINIHKIKNERLSVIINGNRRTLYRVGFSRTDGEKEWAYVNACDICQNSMLGNLPYPVYIQGHAIRRLHERIDCMDPGFRNYYLNTNFLRPKMHLFNNKLLFEFTTAEGYKLGYFSADAMEGMIVIKTFLFLTNGGTPEGRKLEEICGLKKQDKKYWAIDKLSTFKNSDIANTPELKSIFLEAGCNDLFKYLDTLQLNAENQTNQAKQILNYIKQDEAIYA